MEKDEKKHVQLPNNMALDGLTPKDQLIYLYIKRYANEDNNCFPSLKILSKLSGAAVNTIRKSIEVLKEKNYITITKHGRKIEYHFNPYKGFEPFSYDFLYKDDISFTAKSYLAASQQYMFTDVEGYGKVAKSNAELSESINMPKSTVYKCNKELERKEYMLTLDSAMKDMETGCPQKITLINLNKLGQAIIGKLKDHEDKINQNTSDIKKMEQRFAEYDKKIKARDALIEKLINQQMEKNNIPTEFEL